jgi:hypothetical protein
MSHGWTASSSGGIRDPTILNIPQRPGLFGIPLGGNFIKQR